VEEMSIGERRPAAETRHAGQRELVTALVDRLIGKNTVMYEVASLASQPPSEKSAPDCD
jgi:hypothetical protein